MPILSISPTVSQPLPAKVSRETSRTGIEPVEPVAGEIPQDAGEKAIAQSQQRDVPEKPEIKSENYRLSFDQEKRQIYLELLNPVTGDVIQRVPRDDLAFAFAPDENKAPQGVNVTV